MDKNIQNIKNRHFTAPVGCRVDLNLDSNNKDKEEFILSFFEGMISLNESLLNKSLFNILIFNEGKKF